MSINPLTRSVFNVSRLHGALSRGKALWHYQNSITPWTDLYYSSYARVTKAKTIDPLPDTFLRSLYMVT